MCRKDRMPELNGDLTEKVTYIARVISTCKTVKQVWSAWEWGYRVIRNFEKQDVARVKKLELSYEWTSHIHDRYKTYYRMISNSVDNGLLNVANQHAQDKEQQA